jgi:hypothetical protein
MLKMRVKCEDCHTAVVKSVSSKDNLNPKNCVVHDVMTEELFLSLLGFKEAQRARMEHVSHKQHTNRRNNVGSAS